VGGDKALALIEKALGDGSNHGSVHFEAVRALGQAGGEKAMALLDVAAAVKVPDFAGLGVPC